MKTFNSIKISAVALCGVVSITVLAGCGGAGRGTSLPANNVSGSNNATSNPVAGNTPIDNSARDLNFGSLTSRVVGSAQAPVTTTSSSTAVTGIAGASITSLAVNRTSGAATIADSKVIFAKLSGGYNLVVANPDGSGQRTINTGNTYSLYPSFSPDGTKVAYNAYDASGYMQVFVIGINGGTPLKLTSDAAYNYKPNWSPDGTKILYHRAPGDGSQIPCVVPSDGSGAPVAIWGNVTAATPVYSPDGSQIAFGRPVGGYWQIFIANTDGSGTVQLTSGSYQASDPHWSPNGRYITYSRSTDSGKSQIFMVDAVYKNAWQVTSSGFSAYQPSFSPDGTRILFQRYEDSGRYRLYTATTSGSDVQPVTAAADNLYSSAWSGYLKPVATNLIGTGGSLGTGAAGFLYARQGDTVSSVLTFDTAAATLESRSVARVATQTNPDTSSPDLVFSITANDSLSRVAFANFNALSAIPTAVNVPLAVGTTGALVDVNAVTGKVSAVLPYAANRSIHFAPKVEKSGNKTIFHGNFTGVWNDSGENIAPNGATTVQLDAKTGQLLKVE